MKNGASRKGTAKPVQEASQFQNVQSIPASCDPKRTLPSTDASSVGLPQPTPPSMWNANPGYVKRERIELELPERDEREGFGAASLAFVCCVGFMLYGLAVLGGAAYSVVAAKTGLSAYSAVSSR